MKIRAALLLAAITVLPAFAATPQEEWKARIAAENISYGTKPHAVLKLQDAVYLGEGDQATLTGTKGKPESWKWSTEANAKGPLRVTIKNGKPVAIKDGKPVEGIENSVAIDTDIDVNGEPTPIAAHINGWRFWLYNQKAPAALKFTGMAYYPYDPSFRVQGNYVPDPTLVTTTFHTSHKTDKDYYHTGDVTFSLKGKAYKLPIYARSSDPAAIKSAQGFFQDEMTGKGAYPAGRYINLYFDTAANKVNGAHPVVLDFNTAYNPDCARSPYWTCPLTDVSFDLPIKVGERDPHSLEHHEG
jgi:uncharacterized protein (DUF1684 family)